MATEVKFLRFDATNGYHIESDPTDDTLTIAGLTMNGDIGMGGTNEVTGLPATPSGDTAATSKAYVDSLVSGISWKEPALVLKMVDDSDQGGSPPTASAGDAYVVNNWGGGFTDGDIVEYDGTSWNVILDEGGAGEPADGTRVIVTTGTAAGSFTGREGDVATYDATGDTWSFEDPVDGWAILIIGEGSEYENKAYVYDTNAWIQFSGGNFQAGVGLSWNGAQLDVNLGNGITQNPSDYVGIDLSTETGLELVGTSPNQELQVQLDGANGIIRGTSGLELEIDDTPDTLDVDADGLKVVGLPSTFKINYR
jgi:hypothetical protein